MLTRNFLQGRSTRAIAIGTTAIIVLILVGFIAVGGYIALSNIKTNQNSNASSTSSSAPSTSTTSSAPSTATPTTSTAGLASSSTSSFSVASSYSTTLSSSASATTTSVSCPTDLLNQSSYGPQTDINSSTFATEFSQFGPTMDLFGNFSQMSVRQVSTESINMSGSYPPGLPPNMTQYYSQPTAGVQNESSITDTSYSVIGWQNVNGSSLLVVNYTQNMAQSLPSSQFSGEGSENQSGTIYVGSNGNVTLVKSGSSIYVGSYAEEQALTILSAFYPVIAGSELLSPSFSSPLTNTSLVALNQTEVSLGNNLTMNATNYKILSPAQTPYGNLTSIYSACFGNSQPPPSDLPSNMTEVTYVQIGKLPQSNQEIVTFMSFKESVPSEMNSSQIIQLVSLRPVNSTTEYKLQSSTTLASK